MKLRWPIFGITDGSAAAIAETGGRGGRFATVLSAFALGFSGLSFYESVLKSAELEVYVPPVIHYARDDGGSVELFSVPLTVVNSGARTGTILAIDLEVESLGGENAGKTQRYYGAYLGEQSIRDDETKRAFAPVSLAGRGTFSDTIRFYPAGERSGHLVTDAGDYRFRLKLRTAVPTDPDPLEAWLRHEPRTVGFERTLPWISEQQLGMRRATIPMRERDAPAAPAAPATPAAPPPAAPAPPAEKPAAP